MGVEVGRMVLLCVVEELRHGEEEVWKLVRVMAGKSWGRWEVMKAVGGEAEGGVSWEKNAGGPSTKTKQQRGWRRIMAQEGGSQHSAGGRDATACGEERYYEGSRLAEGWRVLAAMQDVLEAGEVVGEVVGGGKTQRESGWEGPWVVFLS